MNSDTKGQLVIELYPPLNETIDYDIEDQTTEINYDDYNNVDIGWEKCAAQCTARYFYSLMIPLQ